MIFDYGCLAYVDLNLDFKPPPNACIRYIYDILRYVNITQYREKTGFFYLVNRRSFFMDNFMYSVMTNETPQYLQNFFHFVDQKFLSKWRL